MASMMLWIGKMTEITCPHCNYELCEEEMHEMRCNGFDLWRVAIDNDEVELSCPSCSKIYFIKGFWIPKFKTSKEKSYA